VSEPPAAILEEDFEYLEAVIFLQNIGRVIGKKGYHKCFYQRGVYW
jgi:hypothetical protein